MSVDETPRRNRASAPQEHHFQTPIVREQPTGPRPAGSAPGEEAAERDEGDEPDDGGDRPTS